MEHITGTANKGEDAIIEREETLRKMSAANVTAQMVALVECFDWIKTFEKPLPKAAEVGS